MGRSAVISLAMAGLAGCAPIGLDARSAAQSRLVEDFAQRGARGDKAALADCVVDRLSTRQQAAVAVALNPAEIEAIVAGNSDPAGLAKCLAAAGGV